MTAEPRPVYDPRDPGFVQDPYPTYRALRERDPVHRSPMGPWVLSRHADVLEALADARLGNAPARHSVLNVRNRHRQVAADVAANILPFLDPPAHTVPRRLVSRAFASHLRSCPPDVEGIARALLADVRGAGQMEVLTRFATPLSVAVLCGVIGLPVEDRERLAGWTEWFFRLFAPIPSREVLHGLEAALDEFRRYLAAHVEERRRSPAADVISGLIEAEEDGTRLSEAEVIDTCMLLFADGVENVDAGIASALLCLLRDPSALERLRAEPRLLPSAVDECLRFESPAQAVARVAREDLEIGGVPIRRNEAVLLLLGSANRDPQAFPDPDRLDVARSPNPYLSFGKGRHSCVGAQLVRTETQGALRVLLDEVPGLSLAEPEPRWRARPGHRWLESLRVRWGD